MNLRFDTEAAFLIGGVIGMLVLASFVGGLLARRSGSDAYHATIANLKARTRSWWFMVVIFLLAMLSGGLGSVILFGLTSFLALREFVTMTPTNRADHPTLLWLFFIITPIQYALVATGWYGLFSIFIPVYAFLFVPLRSVLSGDCERFLQRTATIQWALMICVYCVSYAPALLTLEIPGFEGQNGKLLFYFVLVVQASDVLQYLWGKIFGRHQIAPTVSPNKTLEGFLGGVSTATLLGTGLWWATPFTPWQAAGMSLVITLMGFVGGLVMSAIKRDRGVKDYGDLIQGHGGVMDRIDSLCFSAPIFFHLTRYFFTA
ncbi:MAG TPA: phosphatidate cytidylyltransferase [Terrimicrobiaceae bacterium]